LSFFGWISPSTFDFFVLEDMKHFRLCQRLFFTVHNCKQPSPVLFGIARQTGALCNFVDHLCW
jgi:hypothetical protein